MTDRKDGGPAYPVRNPGTNEQFSGMSLRDYLAGQALMGMYGSKIAERNKSWELAKMAYTAADAMLNERKKEPQP